MAQWDAKVYSDTSLANGSYLTIQPTGTAVDQIATIEYTGAIELYIDALTTNPIASDSAAGIMTNLNLLASNTHYYRVKNVSGGAIYCKAKGIEVVA